MSRFCQPFSAGWYSNYCCC